MSISELKQKYIRELIFLQYRIEHADFIGESQRIRIESEKEMLNKVLKDLDSINTPFYIKGKDLITCQELNRNTLL